MTRLPGLCLQVSVQFEAVSATAEYGADFITTSDHVTLADGESVKLVPVTLINSETPRLQRYFTVRLLNQTATGGAVIGQPASCNVVITETADAHGVFGTLHCTLVMVTTSCDYKFSVCEIYLEIGHYDVSRTTLTEIVGFTIWPGVFSDHSFNRFSVICIISTSAICQLVCNFMCYKTH